MPQLLYAKKLQAARVHPEHARNAATCHNFYMLRSFRQHACSCCAHSHKLKNAAHRDAEKEKKNKQTKPGMRDQKAPCSFFVLFTKLKEEETSSPARYCTGIPLCRIRQPL
jgi:hypothetical protein